MNLYAEYLAAAFPEPRRLLGVDLRPFALGHLLILRWLGNAFVTALVPRIDDLVTGVWACSLSYREAVQALRRGRIDLVVHGRWRSKRREVALEDAFRIWRDELGQFDVAEKVDAFSEYIRSGCNVPMVAARQTHSAADSGSGPPDVQSIKVALMSKLHLSEDDVMDRPWSMCLWDVYTLAAQEGLLTFMDRDEVDRAQSTADRLQAAIDEGRVKL